MNIYFIFITIILIIIINYEEISHIKKITENDELYNNIFYKNTSFNKLLNNNINDNFNDSKNEILIITYDNRINLEYLDLHNNNINEYVEKWGYEYKFYNSCDKNEYWCKIFLVLDDLQTNNYDYVMWMDSDTIINNFEIDLGNILNNYNSDIYIASDNNKNGLNITNSGVFIIKNSEIGKQFLIDCINYFYRNCLDNKNRLKGVWAGACYEQGVINIMIIYKYLKYTTILSNDIILNYNFCNNDVFIMHLYASSPYNRKKCFQEYKIK